MEETKQCLEIQYTKSRSTLEWFKYCLVFRCWDKFNDIIHCNTEEEWVQMFYKKNIRRIEEVKSQLWMDRDNRIIVVALQ